VSAEQLRLLRAIGVPSIKTSARLTGATSHVLATATYILQFGSGAVGFCLERVLNTRGCYRARPKSSKRAPALQGAAAGAAKPELLQIEGRTAISRTQNLDAWDTVRQGMWHFHQVRRENVKSAWRSSPRKLSSNKPEKIAPGTGNLGPETKGRNRRTSANGDRDQWSSKNYQSISLIKI
jgi:hypothetical protein